jgi:hypothetical protein
MTVSGRRGFLNARDPPGSPEGAERRRVAEQSPALGELAVAMLLPEFATIPPRNRNNADSKRID